MAGTASRQLVLVTGGSGFIASYVVKEALDQGFAVRTTVRDKSNEDKCQYLNRLVEEGHPLEIVQADVLDAPEKWEPIIEGAEFVLHVASPFYYDNDTEEELLEPAVQGTLHLLQAIANKGGVKRVVVTSSVAAVWFTKDFEERERPFTEQDFSDDIPNDYAKSKTIAEKKAWEFVEENNANGKNAFEMITINPALVIGPPTYRVDSTSIGSIVNMMNGSMEKAQDQWIGFVDARDVALAHLRAMIHPEAAGHRFIVNSEAFHFNDIADMLREEFTQYGYNVSERTEINMKQPAEVSSLKAQQMLDIKFRPVKESLMETAHKCIDLGYLDKTDAYDYFVKNKGKSE
eukprot:Plantae.Rhodophyta-Purpureofilum_apyrenoidigerum.ctg29736.p1 GENE.Plantae.Rhodophyta-Purpureofilum_apyrenoidigerum.ctg29736~~Plantae.Rhodophyta-Purpureofilum_apyrenoidigerum.ctg29736.p1  ORF type:complete len:346 (+),score=90.89 Plantae.Rhodophyta-Purpureofilum_apyrenoidigerum.ctg29736:57-1094(+)